MDKTVVFDAEWVIDGGTSLSDAIAGMLAFYCPDLPTRVDPTSFTTDRRVFGPSEPVWEAVEYLAALAGMEVGDDHGRTWIRVRVR